MAGPFLSFIGSAAAHDLGVMPGEQDPMKKRKQRDKTMTDAATGQPVQQRRRAPSMLGSVFDLINGNGNQF